MSRVQANDQANDQAKQPVIVDGVTWSYHASGGFNDVYSAEVDGQKKALKIAKASTSPVGVFTAEDAAMDTPQRSVRLWNEINPDYPAQLIPKGWVVPFIDGYEPTVTQKCDAIIDLYQRTGRILLDAMVTGNLKKQSNGKIVYIDIGFALKLESEYEDQKSVVSLDCWKAKKKVYDKFFVQNQNGTRASIIKVVKALLVLQQYRPDVRDASRLKRDYLLVSQLTEAYDKGGFVFISCNDFPLNKVYFSGIPAMQAVLSCDYFSDNFKLKMWRLYQSRKASFSYYRDLIFLLTGKFGVAHKLAFKVIEHIPLLSVRGVADCFNGRDNLFKLSEFMFEEAVSENNDIRSAKAMVRELGILSLHPLKEAWCALKRNGLLGESVFYQICSHEHADKICVAISALARRKKMLTNLTFNQLLSHENLASYADAIIDLSNLNLLTNDNFDKVGRYQDLPALVPVLHTLYSTSLLTQSNFDAVIKDLQLGFVYIRFSESKKLTKEVGNMLYALSMKGLLTQSNIDTLYFYNPLPALLERMAMLLKANSLTQVSFDLIISNNSFASAVYNLASNLKLTKESCDALIALSAENLLTDQNLRFVFFRNGSSDKLIAKINGMPRNSMKQAQIYSLLLELNFDDYLSVIKASSDKDKVKASISSAIFCVLRNDILAPNEKVSWLCKLAIGVMNSCLKKESGVLGKGFFSKVGNTSSYQNAMKQVKDTLLSVLDEAALGSISQETFSLAKDVLAEHVGRGYHIMRTGSLSKEAFLKHDKYYEKEIEAARMF